MRKIKPDQRALNAAMAEAMQRALDERPDVVAEAKRLGVQAKFKEVVANMGPLPTGALASGESPKKTRAKRPDLDAAIDRQLAGGARVLAENPDFAEGHVSRHVQLDPANAIINPAYEKAVAAKRIADAIAADARNAAQAVHGMVGGSYVAECKEGNVTIALSVPSGRYIITTPAGGFVFSAESLEKIASAFYAATDGPFALHKRGQG